MDPAGVARTDGRVFVTDPRDHVIRMIDLATERASIIAGNGDAGYAGDGGPAVRAQLSYPRGIAVDGAGNLYFTDGNRVRQISPAGRIMTVAGGSTAGLAGDGGPAISALLNGPAAMVLDNAGNLYIGDTQNREVRRVTPAGTISTVPGTIGLDAYGVALDSRGNLLVADGFNNRVVRLDLAGHLTIFAGNGRRGSSGDGGPAAVASLAGPTSLAVARDGTVYIGGEGQVRRVDLRGIIRSASRVGFVTGLAVDDAGNLFIADAGGLIRELQADGRTVVIAGNGSDAYAGDGGPAASAQLGWPWGLAVDSHGNVFIADFGAERILRVTRAGTISSIGGTGNRRPASGNKAARSPINQPEGLAVDSDGNLYFADPDGGRVLEIRHDGTLTTLAGGGGQSLGDGIAATAAKLMDPDSVAVDRSGNVFIHEFDTIHKVDRRGIITTVLTDPQLRYRRGLAVDQKGNLFIAGQNRVLELKTDGTLSSVAGTGMEGFGGDGGPATTALLLGPDGLAVDEQGNLYIVDSGNQRIRKVDSTGVITTVAGDGMIGAAGDGGPAVAAQLHSPEGVAVDTEGNIFIADSENRRVRRVEALSGVSGG
jgi:trimeric autotransporter adhesin